jgi:uncharacterized damage-inducible protein DinB
MSPELPTYDVVLPERDDTRSDGPMLGDERAVLEHFLENYRESLLRKCAGLTAGQLAERSVPPSALSLAGLVRHLTEVERYWLTDVAHGEDSPDVYTRRDATDADFDEASEHTAPGDVSAYLAEVEQARRQAARVRDLAAPCGGLRRGQEVNLRWILVHLIEEYARHLGHADLLRERIDRATGY